MIYVASSWKNENHPNVVDALRKAGYHVYDFRNPGLGDRGFHWSSITDVPKPWDAEMLSTVLRHPIAQSGFESDRNALEDCELCVLVLPCGKSAHMELGFAVGIGKPVFVLMPEPSEPELMYSWASRIVDSIPDLLLHIQEWEAGA